jgi:hypothetical protein
VSACESAADTIAETLRLVGTSALALGEFQQVLDLDAEILASMRERGVTTYEMAHIWFGLGHHNAALNFELAALRLNYVRFDPGNIASSHTSLAGYLDKSGAEPAVKRAHRAGAHRQGPVHRRGHGGPDPRFAPDADDGALASDPGGT